MNARDREPDRPGSENHAPTTFVPDAGLGLAHVERIDGLLHEFRNLLDGSLRYVLLARKNLVLGRASTPSLGHEDADDEPALVRAQRQLDVVVEAMEHMASLAHAALQGPGLSLGSVLLAGARPVTLAEVVAHAFDVVRPLAEEKRVALRASFATDVGQLAAGPVYAIVLNAVRNAVESIARAGGGGAVDVRVVARGPSPRGVDTTTARREWFDIEIEDDGEGLGNKPPGRGIGLAVARSVVEELGGTMELSTRPAREGARPGRRGALLRVSVPLALGESGVIH